MRFPAFFVPAMSQWCPNVDDPTLPESVGLVGNREHLRRAGRERLCGCGVGIVDMERDAHGRRTCGPRTFAPNASA